ncbi:MAG: flavin-dependent oxidoreductase [Alphaproteobacteria bacterium]|nr:flavin-dependent oxidoreductase [Alphaproteobacteria bacterium]
MKNPNTDIAIVGGGIAGLALALGLHSRGIPSRVYEVAPEIKELGVGITILPHAMRELTQLGLQEKLVAAGITNYESAFFNRFGQLIYKEPRGLRAGYSYPEVGIHRGRLHTILFEAAKARLGADRIVLNRRCIGLEQNDSGVTLHFQKTTTGAAAPSVRADIALACDGVNSAVRRHFYPGEDVAFEGINTWRGVARGKPILDGHTYIRIGSIKTGKIVIYPIVDDIDGEGNQLINWTTEAPLLGRPKNDWNKPGKLEDFLPIYESWKFDWLDVPALLKRSEVLLEYPMVDKDPIPRWTFGRITFLGDAAHPMYQRGSNGSAQALIDARTLADLMQTTDHPQEALTAYEAARLATTTKIVHTNRTTPPDFINIKVDELTGDRPFDDLDKFISQDELRALSDNYKRIAGFGQKDVG